MTYSMLAFRWRDLSDEQRISHYDQFSSLEDYVHAYFSGGPMFGTIFEEIDGLRYHLQQVLQSGLFTDQLIGINLGVARSTARRFLRHNKTPAYATFTTMMHALADQYDIKDTRDRKRPELPHDIQVKFEGAIKTARGEAVDALDELLEILEGLVPASQHKPDMNRKPVELTVEQYALLLATVCSAQAFSEVETWDQKTVRVIRALNDILLELDKLLETATSVFGKRLRGAVKLVTRPIRVLLDSIDGGGKS